MGLAENLVSLAESGDAVIVDGESGQIHLRPAQDIENAYAEKVRFRARRQAQYRRLRNKPSITRDNVDISLQLNAGLLVDAWDPDRYGGTGKSFNWDLIPDYRPLPIILAGGLSSDNVFAAVKQVKPWAVDVSGGVEQDKGIKDIQKISHFIKEVHRVCKTD